MMTSDSASAMATTAAASETAMTASQSQVEATTHAVVDPQQNPLPKIDPITAVQDSIDALALSLFEALRGVRDAVAPESLEASGAGIRPSAAAVSSTHAFQEAPDELGKNATAKDLLLNGLNMDYFPPRAFDLLEHDYDAFVLAYLNDNPYAKELVDRFAALADEPEKLGDPKQQTTATTSTVGTASASTPDEPKPTSKTSVALGEVGYEFRKKFESGWYTGKVTEIRPHDLSNGYDRRCVYTDGDIEDLRLEDLQELAKLDPNNSKKPKISIKLKVSKSATDGGGSKDTPKDNTTSTNTEPDIKFPLTQEQYTKLLLDTEHQRDVQTTQRLAQDILSKSAAVDDLVANLPGMDRTRQMQMERINELIKSNHEVTRELEEAYVVARERREEVRIALGESTCFALGVEEE